MPTAPPMIKPDGDACTAALDSRPIETSRPTTTSRATTPITGPEPVALENAMPVLKARLNRSVQNRSIVVPSTSALTRPVLGELVDDDDHGRDDQRAAHRGTTGSRRVDASVSRQRRPIPPTFSSTSTVAHGIASRRSRGIGRPDTIE